VSRILVTGGAGFIGTNLVRKLADGGHEVFILDNLFSGRRDYVADPSRFIEADILDHEAMQGAVSGMDQVVHLAAYGNVVESVEDPLANFEINARGTLSVLESVRRAGVRKLIFASTGGALIGNARPPVNEESLPRPISPYGAGKLCCEAYIHAYSHCYGVPSVILRFANVYGPYSAHKKGAVTRFMHCLLSGEPITIYGDGTSTRDYLHVDDLCDGIIAAMERDVEPAEVFHLASGVESSILDVAQTLLAAAGKPDHPIRYQPKRKGEVERNFALYDKAHRVLGFHPTMTFQEGIARTWKWFVDHRPTGPA
jgi:UDP-glucose 4-epimerase